MIHIFCIFLLPLSSIASSGFHPTFTIESKLKCEHKVKDKRFPVRGKENFLSLVRYMSWVYELDISWVYNCELNVFVCAFET